MEITCNENTLVFDPDLCVGCGMCSQVCPQGVFSAPKPVSADKRLVRASLEHAEDCMECGACALNCLTGAIHVESGVGCASAMIYAALTGKEVSCGGASCCGAAPTAGSTCCGLSSARYDTSCSPEEKAGCCSVKAQSKDGEPESAHSECCTWGGLPKKGCC